MTKLDGTMNTEVINDSVQILSKGRRMVYKKDQESLLPKKEEKIRMKRPPETVISQK